MKDHFLLYRSFEATQEITRLITVIRGFPFYCSSGTSSGSPGTWLPFLSVSEPNGTFIKDAINLTDCLGGRLLERYRDIDEQGDYEAGYKARLLANRQQLLSGIEWQLFTSHEHNEFSAAAAAADDDILSQESIPDGFPSEEFMSFNLKKSDFLVLERFGSLEALYISKCIGGGFWESEQERLSAFFAYIERRVEALLMQKVAFCYEGMRIKSFLATLDAEQIAVVILNKIDECSGRCIYFPEAIQKVNLFLRHCITSARENDASGFNAASGLMSNSIFAASAQPVRLDQTENLSQQGPC
jgi:hypothetical protein